MRCKKHFYRPQTKLRKGYVFTPVCHSVHGGMSAPVHAGIHTSPVYTPPGQIPPKSRHPLGSRHSPKGDTLREVDTPLEADTPPGSRHPLEADTPRSRHPPAPGSRHPPPMQKATVADGTLPTGMHSCLFCSSVNILTNLSLAQSALDPGLKPDQCVYGSMWTKMTGLLCWLLRGQQVLYQR